MKAEIIVILAAALALQACHSNKTTQGTAGGNAMPEIGATSKYHPTILSGTVAKQPKAIVYRTSVPCPDLVPVQLSADGTSLISYPAPGDISEAHSTPLQLDGGWWLDRRGIGPGTAFTTYTYAEYSAMAQAPSQSEILAHIDRKAYITDMYALPLTASEAAAKPDICNKYIADGFTDCEKLRTFAH